MLKHIRHFEICGAFVVSEALEDRPNAPPSGVDGSFLGLAQEGLELGKDLLDGIEIGTIGREEEELGADSMQSNAHCMVLVASEVAYAQNFPPWSVISRPIKGDVPTIDLVIGYNKANVSPTLKLFLSRVDALID
jgi:hypothetical protein